MRPSLLLAAVVFAFSGCAGGYDPYLPDGGRARVNCNAAPVDVPVTVLDRGGSPYPEAIVSVTYVGTGEQENLVADARGIAILTDKHGPGVVRVFGDVGGFRSDVAEVTFVGTECSSAVTPRALTLQVR